MNGFEAGAYNLIVTLYSPDSMEQYKNKYEPRVIYEKNGDPQRSSGRLGPSLLNESPFFEEMVSQGESSVKKNDNGNDPVNEGQPQLSRKVDRLSDLEVLERAAKGMELGELDAEQKAALEEFGFAAGASPCPTEWEIDFRIRVM